MVKLLRSPKNPLLIPDKNHDWESSAVFNASVVEYNNKYFMVYRAFDSNGRSSIGLASGETPDTFSNRSQFIKPEFPWENSGCEDPRITKLDGQFFISYTAISTWPPTAEGIKVGLAITSDFSKIDEKHPLTTFNSKALGFFPEKINGKYAAILAANTDKPPAKIGVALFDKKEDIWSEEYWNNWYAHLEENSLNINVNDRDHIEVGASPIKVNGGWLLIYSYIENYFSDAKGWTIQALLLDHKDPLKIIGKSQEPLLYPNEDYEIYGNVYNLIFPSGALLSNDVLYVYYGGADTVICAACCNINDLLRDISGNI